MSATPTFTPALNLVQLYVLDQQNRVVTVLAGYLASGTVTGINLSTTYFVPEQDRHLLITDNNGGGSSFSGATSGGTALPNGYYRIEAILPDGAQVERPFYLEHKTWAGGQMTAALPLRGSAALITWSYQESVNVTIELYNLAGELIWRDRGAGATGTMTWALTSTSGRHVSDGIYLIRARAASLDGSVEDDRMLKLAVIR